MSHWTLLHVFAQTANNPLKVFYKAILTSATFQLLLIVGVYCVQSSCIGLDYVLKANMV